MSSRDGRACPDMFASSSFPIERGVFADHVATSSSQTVALVHSRASVSVC